MKKTVLVVVLTLPLLSTAAKAQERGGDAALGALSGAVVLGPIGAVAGAVVGYTAGPSIAHSWGLRRSTADRRQSSAGRPRQANALARGSDLPPRDRVVTENAVSAPPAPPRTPPANARTDAGMPPVQGLE
jgi:hypothetical protein